MVLQTATHQRISRELLVQLANYLVGQTSEVYSAPLDVRLFEQEGETPEQVTTVLLPDLMVVCDRAKIDERGIHGAPDLIIEILSKLTYRIDPVIKLDFYQCAGVREYWIVDPVAQTVSVYTLEEEYGAPSVYNESDSVPVGVLDDCIIDLRPRIREKLIWKAAR